MAAGDSTIRNAIVTIKVFGVGGGGNNVLTRMADTDLDMELVAVNTDARQLSGMSTRVKTIRIGESITRGRGTGGNISLGEQAAQMDEAKIRAAMAGADLIFVTAGMGGGAGTGAAPVVARIAQELGILTIGVVTMPFSFEGARKKRAASEGVLKMQSYMDALVVIQNDNLMKLPENRQMTMLQAFVMVDNVLQQAIRCVAELILTTGFVNVDFADVTTIFRQSVSSDALLCMGQANGAVEAVKVALDSPLIDRTLKGARALLLNITGSDKLTLWDVDEATNYIAEYANVEVNIIFGTVIDPDMGEEVRATIIATDFVDSVALKAKSLEVPKTLVEKVTVPSEAKPTEQPVSFMDTPEFMMKKPKETPAGAFAIPAFPTIHLDDEMK